MDLTVAKNRLIASLRTQIGDERVLSAMAAVPRELFIPPQLESLAYSDEPLPIGHNQTISQPYVVAKMTEALELKESEKVLEIGTGSGYQTAILAKLARLVISTERIPELSESAARLLHKMGYTNIQFEVTGSELGWEAGAPYRRHYCHRRNTQSAGFTSSPTRHGRAHGYSGRRPRCSGIVSDN